MATKRKQARRRFELRVDALDASSFDTSPPALFPTFGACERVAELFSDENHEWTITELVGDTPVRFWRWPTWELCEGDQAAA